MGVGPNYGLDKGFLATGSTAYAQFEICAVIANPNSVLSTVANAIQRNTSASPTSGLLVVVQEPLDTVRLATGKAVLDCRIYGITRVLSGAAVTKLTRVTSDATARAVSVSRTAAGSQPVPVLGIALTDATAAGQQIDVLLTPGASY